MNAKYVRAKMILQEEIEEAQRKLDARKKANHPGTASDVQQDIILKGIQAAQQRLRELKACDPEEAEAELEIVQIWKDQMPQNWQAARDFLARRNPERWANHEKLDLKAETKGGMVIELLLPSNGVNQELDHLVYDKSNNSQN